MKFKTMIAPACLLSLAFVCSSNSRGFEDSNMLLKPVDMTVTDLKEKQSLLLDRIKKDPATIKVEVVLLQEGLLSKLGSGPVVIHLPGAKNLEMKDYSITKNGSETKIHWKKGDNASFISLTGKSVHGLIYDDKQVYSVSPLGSGLQAVSQIDQSKYKDHPAGGDKK